MSLLQRKKSLQHRERAFSLVEVAFAMAVLAFAMITLMGLLPLALTTFRETKRDTVHANILQYIAAQANLTPFFNLMTLNSPYGVSSTFAVSTTPWTFDDQGELLSTNLTTLPAGTIYQAFITGSYATSLSGGQASLLPNYNNAVSAPTLYSTNTYLLSVEIVDTDQPNRPTTNTIVVPNMGK